ncbi:zinc finger protein CONSTANS-like protein [Striga asiatica]|uniref:Zinc finger protein CONSTANS-like protein n=1 Tax=Striga asiatica TaxID=4170 RepID=A0A5A7Q934_STRAF|nr:zinc finger protein CONSTANS-like protein [Striga asiatica]
MSSSCLSGGRAAAYRLESLNLDMIKSPSSTSWISNSSSPSSTLSESSNCPLTISTRKPRTPRKRPNQTYNEAAAILSTAHPKLFPKKPSKLTKSIHNKDLTIRPDPPDLLMPFRAIDHESGFLLRDTQRPDFSYKLNRGLCPFDRICQSPGEIESNVGGLEDFDAESIILDEEIGEGINCIMGDLGEGIELIEGFDVCSESNNNNNSDSYSIYSNGGFCYGYPVGLGFGFGFGPGGVRKERRDVDDGGGEDWWRFPSVSAPEPNSTVAAAAAGRGVLEEKKKKKKKVAEIRDNTVAEEAEEDGVGPRWSGAGLMLKLNYDGVLREWSDKASPFTGEGPAAEAVAGNDVQARLAQIDLFSDNGGIREASVLRYKEKRRNRLFSKKIRYQVRKVNADRRPRMKGRFVRTPNSSDD